jgi:hypothetical protein
MTEARKSVLRDYPVREIKSGGNVVPKEQGGVGFCDPIGRKRGVIRDYPAREIKSGGKKGKRVLQPYEVVRGGRDLVDRGPYGCWK